MLAGAATGGTVVLRFGFACKPVLSKCTLELPQTACTRLACAVLSGFVFGIVFKHIDGADGWVASNKDVVAFLAAFVSGWLSLMMLLSLIPVADASVYGLRDQDGAIDDPPRTSLMPPREAQSRLPETIISDAL